MEKRCPALAWGNVKTARLGFVLEVLAGSAFVDGLEVAVAVLFDGDEDDLVDVVVEDEDFDVLFRIGLEQGRVAEEGFGASGALGRVAPDSVPPKHPAFRPRGLLAPEQRLSALRPASLGTVHPSCRLPGVPAGRHG